MCWNCLDMLKISGIDISKYTAHSCRSASTSKAKILEISLNDILKRGQKYYNKEIESQSQSHFETVVLNS